MANLNRPNGFQPIRRLGGGRFGVDSCIIMFKAGSEVMVPGDPVVATAAGDTTTGYTKVVHAPGTEGTPATITGIVMGILPPQAGTTNLSILNQAGYNTGDTGPVLVNCDPDVVYEIQEDATGPLALTNLYQECNFLWAAGDTTRWISNVVLNATNVGTGNQCKILAFRQRLDNAIGIYGRWEVLINASTNRAVSTHF